MPYQNLNDGLYLVSQPDEIDGIRIEHHGILDIGNVLQFPEANGTHPVIVHQTFPHIRVDWLSNTGYWNVLGHITDVTGAIQRLKAAFANPEYELFGYECAHFARFMAQGERYSNQIFWADVGIVPAGALIVYFSKKEKFKEQPATYSAPSPIAALKNRDEEHYSMNETFPDSIEVLYKELNNLTYPLIFHVCRPRKLYTTDVHSLFQAQCPACNSIMNTVALMQIGDILETGGITPTPLHLICPQCGADRVRVKFKKLTDDEKSGLLGDKYFSKLSCFSLTSSDANVSNADSLLQKSKEAMKYSDFIANLGLAIISVHKKESGAEDKLKQAVSREVQCSFCKAVVDPVNSFRKSDASFVCPNCNELWIKF